jgi:hypothetical protein
MLLKASITVARIDLMPPSRAVPGAFSTIRGLEARYTYLDCLDDRLYAALFHNPASIFIDNAEICEGSAAVELNARVLGMGTHRPEDGLDGTGEGRPTLVSYIVRVEEEDRCAAVFTQLHVGLCLECVDDCTSTTDGKLEEGMKIYQWRPHVHAC